MQKSRFPHPLLLIFGMVIVAQIATYFVQPGEFERDGRKVLPGTYSEIAESEAPDLAWHTFLTSIPKGMEAAQDIIFFVFIIGGVIAIMRATGAIDALIGTAIRAFSGTPVLLVAGMTTLFAIGSSTIGMAEEYLPFVPILVSMGLAMKMDALVALAMVYVGYGVGYGCAALNPFTVVIAQDIAGLETYSGWWLRVVLMLVCLAIGVHHVMRYAKRVSTDPSKSLVGDVDYSKGFELPEDTKMTPARVLVLTYFAVGIGVFVWGTKTHDWYLTELAAIFLVIGILSAVTTRMSPNRVASKFCEGAGELTTTALLIGFARAIQVVLDDGKIIDTIIQGIAEPLREAGSSVAAIGMLGVQTVCNFFIPSGSGQAYVTMPIMAPLGELTGVSKQTAVLAYQIGDGFTNTIVPTNAVLMGMLALGKIPYQRWLKFMLPLLIKLYVVAAIALVLANEFGYE